MKTNANPARGLLLGHSVPDLTKAWKQMAEEVEVLDYIFGRRVSIYQSKALILAGVSPCYFGTLYNLENAPVSFGSNARVQF